MEFEFETLTLKNQVAYKTKDKNVYDTLFNSARRFPHKIAIRSDDHAITYSQLLDLVDRLAAYYKNEMKLQEKQKVAMLQENRNHFCISFYALLKLGCTVVILNPKLSADELQNLVEFAKPSALILNACWLEKITPSMNIIDDIMFTESRKEMERYPMWNQSHEKEDNHNYHFLPQALEQRCSFEDSFPAASDKNLPALIIFTSGTTGTPKGVILSHNNIIQSIYSYADALKLDEKEITVLSVPVFHITGLICVMALFIYIGGEIIFLPRFNARQTLEAIQEFGATHFHAVATVYLLLAKELADDSRNYHLPDFRMAVCGGGAVSEETIKQIKNAIPGLDFYPSYGLTESAGAGVVFPCDYNKANKPYAAGRLLSIIRITIRDNKGNELPVGSIGEVCMEGPVIMKNYLNRPPLPHGVLYTGDVGKLDEDGYLYILDRIKDMINRGGEKIYSTEIERLMIGMSGVEQAALFGIPNKLYGEVPVLAVILDDDNITAECVKSFLEGKIAKYKMPVDVFIMLDFPRSANGKVLKGKIKELYMKNHCERNADINEKT